MIGFIAKRLTLYALLMFALLVAMFIWWNYAVHQQQMFLDRETTIQVYH